MVSWKITINSHPEPNVIWINNKNETINNDKNKYIITTEKLLTRTIETFAIKNIEISDIGNYTVFINNSHQNMTYTFNLAVKGKFLKI